MNAAAKTRFLRFQDAHVVPRPARPERVKLVSMNVERLGYDKDCGAHEQTGPIQDGLAKDLVDLDGDMVSLQEVPSAEQFERFVAEKLPEGAYPFRAWARSNTGKATNIAILSRYPIAEFETHANKKFAVRGDSKEMKFYRDVPEAKLDVGGYPLRVYSVHLKADPFYLSDFTEADVERARNLRASELDGVGQVIDEDQAANPGEAFAAVGDSNTVPDAPEMVEFRARQGLADPLEGLTGPESWSHPASQRRLDAMLVPTALADWVLAGSVFAGEDASDHRAVSVTVDLKGYYNAGYIRST